MTTFIRPINDTLQMAAEVAVKAAYGEPLYSELRTVKFDQKAADAVLTFPGTDLAALDALSIPRFVEKPEMFLSDGTLTKAADVEIFGLTSDPDQAFLNLSALAAYLLGTLPLEQREMHYQDLAPKYEQAIDALASLPPEVQAFLKTFVPDYFARVLSVMPRAFLNKLYPNSPDGNKEHALKGLIPHLYLQVVDGKLAIDTNFDARWGRIQLGSTTGKLPDDFPTAATLSMELDLTSTPAAVVVTEAAYNVPNTYALTSDEVDDAGKVADQSLALLSPEQVTPTIVELSPGDNAVLLAALRLQYESDFELKQQTTIGLLSVDSLRGDYRLAFAPNFADKVENILLANNIPATRRGQTVWEIDPNSGVLTIFYNRVRAYQFEELPNDEGSERPYTLLKEIGTEIGRADFIDVAARLFNQALPQLITREGLTSDTSFEIKAAESARAGQLNVSAAGEFTITLPAFDYKVSPNQLDKAERGRVVDQAPYAIVSLTPADQIRNITDLSRFKAISVSINRGPDNFTFGGNKLLVFASLRLALRGFYEVQLGRQGLDLSQGEKDEISDASNVDDLTEVLIALFTKKSNAYFGPRAGNSELNNLGQILALIKTLKKMLTMLELDNKEYATSIASIKNLLATEINPVALFLVALNDFLDNFEQREPALYNSPAIADLISAARVGWVPALATLFDTIWANQASLSAVTGTDPSLLDLFKKLLVTIPDTVAKTSQTLFILKVSTDQKYYSININPLFDALSVDSPLRILKNVIQDDVHNKLLSFLYVVSRDAELEDNGDLADAFTTLSALLPQTAGTLPPAEFDELRIRGVHALEEGVRAGIDNGSIIAGRSTEQLFEVMRKATYSLQRRVIKERAVKDSKAAPLSKEARQQAAFRELFGSAGKRYAGAVKQQRVDEAEAQVRQYQQAFDDADGKSNEQIAVENAQAKVRTFEKTLERAGAKSKAVADISIEVANARLKLDTCKADLKRAENAAEEAQRKYKLEEPKLAKQAAKAQTKAAKDAVETAQLEAKDNVAAAQMAKSQAKVALRGAENELGVLEEALEIATHKLPEAQDALQQASDALGLAQRNSTETPYNRLPEKTKLEEATRALSSAQQDLASSQELVLLKFDRQKFTPMLRGAVSGALDTEAARVTAARMSAIAKMNDVYGGVPCLITKDAAGTPVSAEFVGIGDPTVHLLSAPRPVKPSRSIFNMWSRSKAPVDVASEVEKSLLEQVAPKPHTAPINRRLSSALIFLFTSEQFIMVEELLALFL